MTLKRLRSVLGFATAPVRVSRGGCSFQSGRASAPSIPQPVHTMRGPNVAPAPRGFFTVVCSALAFCPPAPLCVAPLAAGGAVSLAATSRAFCCSAQGG
jgi:hypothetical protein